MTSMQTWVIMITMSKLIRFDDNDLDAYDHDDHEDDYDDVEIPPCPRKIVNDKDAVPVCILGDPALQIYENQGVY